MDAHETLHQAIAQAERIADRIGDDDLARPTPCADFDVRALLNHLVASTEGLADAASGEQWDTSTYGQDLVGDDPKGAFRRATTKLRDATADPSALERTWAMPFGPSPGAQGAGIGIMELAQHAWDLAKATGQADDPGAFDDDVSRMALDLGRKFMPPDDQRPAEAFGPTVDVPDDAPLHDQLAGFLGRQP
jgi:uncharacterized protein (TIGR03086 family)